MRHVTKSAEPITLAGGDAERHAPRLHPAAQRPRRAGLVEIPSDMFNEEVPEPLALRAGDRHRATAPIRTHVREAAAQSWQAKRPVIYAGTGVHWARGLAAAEAARRAARHPGHAPASAARARFPETHPLALGSRRRRLSRSRCGISSTQADLIFGIGCSFTETNFGVADAEGQDESSTPRSTRITSTRTCRAALGLVGDARLTLDALHRRARQTQQSRRATRCGTWRARSPTLRERLARRVDAEAHLGRGAAHRLPRALGPAAHGRRRQHHHHPRRRQPARPALAVLGLDRAAHLHRLGQDHAARLRARPRHGRQARHARQALHQRLGRRGDRLHRHGFRDRGARAHPDPVDPAQQLLDGDRARR